MAQRLKHMGPRLTVDDGFHVPTTLDHFWTETNWFAMVIPDRKITVQLYPFFQTNLDVCSAGVYIWDDTGDQWWNCRYAKNFWHLPFPRQPLYDLQLPNGLRYKTLESLQKYAIGFDCPDGEDVHLDVIWEGIVPVNRGKSGNHLDQPGRISGTLVLHGETIQINGVGFRDRTWSPRSQVGQGVGPFPRDAQNACPIAMRIDVTDEQGRTAHIEGTNVNRFVVNVYPSLLVWECQTQWVMDGINLVGEDEDNWGIHDFRRFLRR